MDEKWMFQPFKTVSNTVRTATGNFRTDAVNIRMALEKFRTGDASRSNGTEKISNGSHHVFEWLMKNFKQMMPTI